MRAHKILALVGRTNVGKSTLFNALTRKRRRAIVADMEGVTRDFLQEQLKGIPGWFVVDTPGWDDQEPFFMRTREQYMKSLEEADCVAVVLDGQIGLTTNDYALFDALRKHNIPFVVCINKTDKRGQCAHPEVQRVSASHTCFALSGLHGIGLEAFCAFFKQHAPLQAQEPEEKGMHIVFLGRPNVGKSTLFNALIGENLTAVSDLPGTTRDTVWRMYKDKEDQNFCFFDTAGLRRRVRVDTAIEKMSAHATRDALRFAHVACLILDATQPLERQDLRLLHEVCANGRSILFLLNKIDLIKDKRRLLRGVSDFFEKHVTDIYKPLVLSISAFRGEGLKKIIPAVKKLCGEWSQRISTARLNKALEEWTSAHPPPRGPGARPIKVRYIAQINVRPPTFFISVSQAKSLPASYVRFLRHSIQKSFGFERVPVRLVVRSSQRPSSS